MTVYVEAPTPTSVIVARVCVSVLSVFVVLFGGVLTLTWAVLRDVACELTGEDGCEPGVWPTSLPFAISVACALVAIAAAFLARRPGAVWLAGTAALAVGSVCPVLVLLLA